MVAFPPHPSQGGRQGAQKLQGPVVGMPGFVITGRQSQQARPQRLWEELGPPDLRTRSRQKLPGGAEDRAEDPETLWMEARPDTLTHCLSRTGTQGD